MRPLLLASLVAACGREAEQFQFRVSHWRNPGLLFPSLAGDESRRSVRNSTILGSIASVLGARTRAVTGPAEWEGDVEYQGRGARGFTGVRITYLKRDERPGSQALNASTCLGPKDLMALFDPSWILAGWNLDEEGRDPDVESVLTFIRATPRHPLTVMPRLIERSDSLKIGYDEQLRIIAERQAYLKGELLEKVTVVSFQVVERGQNPDLRVP